MLIWGSNTFFFDSLLVPVGCQGHLMVNVHENSHQQLCCQCAKTVLLPSVVLDQQHRHCLQTSQKYSSSSPALDPRNQKLQGVAQPSVWERAPPLITCTVKFENCSKFPGGGTNSMIFFFFCIELLFFSFILAFFFPFKTCFYLISKSSFSCGTNLYKATQVFICNGSLERGP